jgi:hypothetical protein
MDAFRYKLPRELCGRDSLQISTVDQRLRGESLMALTPCSRSPYGVGTTPRRRLSSSLSPFFASGRCTVSFLLSKTVQPCPVHVGS